MFLLAAAPTYETEVVSSSSGNGIWVLLLIVAIVGWFKSGSHGHSAHGHVHHFSRGDGGRKALQRHEAAHQRVCQKAGGGGSTVSIWRDGDGWSGKTTFHDWRRVAKLPPEKKIAISAAGIMAAPNTTSPTDGDHIKYYASQAPRGQRAAVIRKGKSLARRYI